jgi:hypothetical protein
MRVFPLGPAVTRSLHEVFVRTTGLFRGQGLSTETLSCSVSIDSYIYMFRLELISRRHKNQQKVWKYKYTI